MLASWPVLLLQPKKPEPWKDFSPFNLRINFIGHADATGSDTYNNTLPAPRALHLQRYFVLKGLPKYLSTSYGLGETVPIANNNSVSGHKMNRRVSLIFCTINYRFPDIPEKLNIFQKTDENSLFHAFSTHLVFWISIEAENAHGCTHKV